MFISRLVNYCYELYMKGDTYYRIGNLDSRLNNVDQVRFLLYTFLLFLYGYLLFFTSA